MNVLAAIVFFAYVPALIILWYFYHQDRLEPEPRRYVIGTFILGATLSVGIAFIIESVLTPKWGGMALLFPGSITWMAFVAGTVEEPSKALAILLPFRRGQMDGIMDGVVYGVAAGLGFAATENLLYGLGYGLETTVLRAFLTPLAHATWTAIVGVGYGLISEGRAEGIWSFLTTAMFLHFLWDYFAFLSMTVPAYNVILIFLLLMNLAILRYLTLLGIEEDIKKRLYYVFRWGW